MVPNNATILSGMEWLWPAKRASVWVTGGTRRRVNLENPPMRIYIIGNDGITLCREAPATVNQDEIAVASKEDLHAARLSGKRLLALWNALPGVEKRRKVGDREALIDQLYAAATPGRYGRRGGERHRMAAPHSARRLLGHPEEEARTDDRLGKRGTGPRLPHRRAGKRMKSS